MSRFRTSSSTPIARSEPKSACSTPSVMNGPRMKPFDAPTRRMMPISRRRAVMERRMVLLMKMNAMNVSSATSTTHAIRM